MSEIVAVLHRFDLPVAAGLAQQRGARVFLIDPVMHGRCVAQDIADPLVQTRFSADLGGAAFAQAQAAALTLCRELGAQLADIAPAARAGAWSAHRLIHLFWTLFGYQRLWAEALAAQPPAHWHVLLPQLAHTYGTHSFVPALALVNALRERGLPHSAYAFDCPGLDAYLLPDLRRVPADVELLTHLPTCNHDARFIAEELGASGLRCMALSSQLYDIELDGIAATGLVDLPTVSELLGPARCGRVKALELPLKAVLRAHLAPHIGQQRFLEMQVQALWEALRAQALFYLWLEQSFAGRLPRQVLISNHDATVHGALMSFAHQHGLAISVLPHSRVHNVPVRADGLSALCLHHVLQDGPCLDLAERALAGGALAYPGGWREPPAQGELRTLGVVLNGISVNGMCLVDFDAYVDGLRHLRAWAQQRGLALRLRVRTVETPVVLLALRLQLDVQELLQLAQGSLLDFARGCDLCLGYDAPTSGLQDLVREGQAVLQAEFRPLARHEWSIVDERVIARYSLPEACERLALMQANPALFQAFRRRQFDAAWAAQQAARPLRDWLRDASAG